jgi:hypothetical protein
MIENMGDELSKHLLCALADARGIAWQNCEDIVILLAILKLFP